MSSGATQSEAVRGALIEAATRRRGARLVEDARRVLSDPAVDRLMQCGAREVVVTDTLPIPEDRRFPQLTVLSIAPLLARAIREVFDDGSVTSLFDGQA